MPSKTPAQNRLMHLALKDPEVRKRKGISKSVAKEYVEADKRKKGNSR